MPVMITLNQIKAHNPCDLGWKAILRGQSKTEGDDVEFPLVDAFKSNPLNHVIWALRCIERSDISIAFAKACAIRAKKYAAGYAGYAAYTAYAAADYADAADAAGAAAYAYAAAAYAAAAAAEREAQKQHLISLLS